jgi:mono/diheme cytochrome c family protein
MTAKRIRLGVVMSLLLILARLAFGVANGAWLLNVPARDHKKTNPYRGQHDAIAAGRRVFTDHCSQCHGQNAEGRKKRPTLRSSRVQVEATEGDLHWLLVNGNMWKGMPSWSKLGDPQIWQVITYVKSLRE